ncbi:MAG: PAS domain-containing protein [Candidatus Thermoplasmatota archaeon]|nr:PAS domain-containing protein [Candidatus Thermoplasmatota archaeon]
MDVELLLLVAPLIIASFLSLASAVFVLKKEHTQVSFWFSMLMAMIIVWSVGYALELIFLDETLTLFFAKLKYVGIVFTPVTWASFSISYTKKRFSITNKMITGLFIIPIISLITLFTNPLHHLFWRTISFDGINTISIVSGNANFFFWIHTIYSYFLIVFGTVLIISLLFRTKDIFTKQNIILLTGILTPFIGNIFIVFELVHIPYGYDITPFLFVLSGVAFSIAIVYFRFLELIPAAREEIFEHVKQGIFVLNESMKIVDKNTTADELLKQGFLSASDNNVIGNSINTLFQNIFSDGIQQAAGIQKQTVQLSSNSDTRWFEISMNPLFDKHNNLEGHLVALDDVSIQKRTEKKLKEKIDELKQFKQVTVDRELRMMELKKQIETLQKKCNRDDER